MFVKCQNLTQCVVAMSSKAEMLEFLEDRSRSLGSELDSLEARPSLFSYQRVIEIREELGLIVELQKLIV